MGYGGAPLTIAYRSNTRHTFCTESHVTKSLEAMGHRVVLLQEDQVTWDACVSAAKAAQVFLWTKTWSIDEEGGHEALRAIRAAGTPSMALHLDRYVGLQREEQITHDPFWKVDLVVTADGGSDQAFAAYGVNHFWQPPAVYDAECGIGKPNKRRFPERVVFVGSHPYPHAEWRPYRDELIARLQAHLGRDFGVYPKTRNQPIRGKALADLYATAEVVIGDSCLSGDPTPARYWSDRLTETIGRGAFLIHPEVAGMEEWYTDGEHLRTYPLGDFDALLALVDKYLADPDERRRIAAAGQALVLSRDTYKHRMATVLDVLDEQFGIPEPRIPVPVSATVHAAEERPVPRPGFSSRPNSMTVSGRAARAPGPVLVRVRHRGRGQPAAFELAEGTTDRIALDEVWSADTYGMEAGHVYGKTCLDIGANLGGWSVLVARMGAASVHAYEPHPDTHAVLLRNLERNGVSAKVTAHRQAVLGKAHSRVLVGAGGGAHIGGPGEGTLVPGIGICEAIDAAAGPDGTLVIKSDCEGGEIDWFDGLPDPYLARIDRLVMEWHGYATMPHLGHLNDDGRFIEHWQAMVTRLADHGRVAIFGHPTAGGILSMVKF